MLEKIVKTNQFTSVEDMKDRIAFLEDLKNKQEDDLKLDLIEIYKSLQPAELVKSAIDNIREDVEVGEKAGGLAGSLGLNYIVGRLTGKNKGPVGYLKALAVQQIVNFIYRKNERAINRFVGNLTQKALKKLHVIDEEEPKSIVIDQEIREQEKEEEQDMKEAQDKVAKPKPKMEPTKNKSLTDPTPGPGKDTE